MLNKDLRGVVCAVATPFDSETGMVEPHWVKEQLAFLQQHGVDGILMLGTTGEWASMSYEERRYVIDVMVRNRGDLFTIALTGGLSLKETFDLSIYAINKGVDAQLLLPPFYYKDVSQEGVLRYFQSCCDMLQYQPQARIMLYHIPSVTGIPITPFIIDGLLESHPDMFFGLKDTGKDPKYTAELVARYPQLHIYSGSDTHAAASLEGGVYGMISAFANFCPDLVRAVYDAHMQGGDVATAQKALAGVRNLVDSEPTIMAIPAIKAMIPWRHSDETSLLHTRTNVRYPLCNLGDDDIGKLWNGLKALNVGIV